MEQEQTFAAQLRAARALLGLSQQELAQIVGVSSMTIKRVEAAKGASVSSDTIGAIRTALERCGAIFVPENGQGAGVRLRKG